MERYAGPRHKRKGGEVRLNLCERLYGGEAVPAPIGRMGSWEAYLPGESVAIFKDELSTRGWQRP